MPIVTSGDPFYDDSTNPAARPVTQTPQVIAKLMGIQKASLRSDFIIKFKLTLNYQVRDVEIEQFFPRGSVYFYQRVGK